MNEVSVTDELLAEFATEIYSDVLKHIEESTSTTEMENTHNEI